MALISVIVPFFNSESYLQDCLNSLHNQSVINYEVILINDGSSDSSSTIALQMAERDPRFHYYYQDNQGVSAARNFGIEVAMGEYLTFVDSDDVVAQNYLEALQDIIQKKSSPDLILFNFSYTNESFTKDKLSSKALSRFITREDFVRLVLSFSYRDIGPKGGYVFNKCYRRDILQSIKFNLDLTCSEDEHFNCLIVNRLRKIYFCNTGIYFYRFVNNSLSHNNNFFLNQAHARRLILNIEHFEIYNKIALKAYVVCLIRCFIKQLFKNKVSATSIHQINYERHWAEKLMSKHRQDLSLIYWCLYILMKNMFVISCFFKRKYSQK